MFHAIFLFWAVKFPFSYRQLRISGRIRYAHVISVLLALIIPLPGALFYLKSGFLSPRNPPLICFGAGTDHGYYTFTLPISISLGSTSCLLMLTFWKIFKVGKEIDWFHYWVIQFVKITSMNYSGPITTVKLKSLSVFPQESQWTIIMLCYRLTIASSPGAPPPNIMREEKERRKITFFLFSSRII